MSWVIDHSQVLTAVAIFAVPLTFALFIGYLYKNTPEQPKPQINPEDYPPLGYWGDEEHVIKSIEAIEALRAFPAGAYIHVDPETNHTELATAEDHNAIADGKGGYIK